MKNVSFDKAIAKLPPFCFALMQNRGKDEQKSFSDQLKLVQDNLAIDPPVKALLLGLLLMDLVGLNVLKEAAKQLEPHIRYDVEQPRRTIKPAALMQLLDEVRRSTRRAQTASRPAMDGQNQPIEINAPLDGEPTGTHT